ncbi:MAG: 30S ribosomal protein S5 [Thermoprotei archaeon]|nr:MAG: 30S ribosomal protein S5 [Thermoprotei archaeon]
MDTWSPKTRLGTMVKQGKITSIEQIFANNLPIKEIEIIDVLIPDLKYEVLSFNLVQKQTDAGETSRFQVLVAVGNMNGYIGIGLGKAKQVREAIENAVKTAKLNIIPVRRGCGSWECGCGLPHSLPFKDIGKSGHTIVEILPAPRGIGLVAGEKAKILLRLAGIQDAWTRSRGNTQTTINFIKAVFNALKKTYSIKTISEW